MLVLPSNTTVTCNAGTKNDLNIKFDFKSATPAITPETSARIYTILEFTIKLELSACAPSLDQGVEWENCSKQQTISVTFFPESTLLTVFLENIRNLTDT